MATQARFWVKLAKGRFCSPQSFQHRTRSSTRAWPRWRHSRTAASKFEGARVRDETRVPKALRGVEQD